MQKNGAASLFFKRRVDEVYGVNEYPGNSWILRLTFSCKNKLFVRKTNNI